jgi:hypothetical protein
MITDVLKYSINNRDISLNVCADRIRNGEDSVLYLNDGRNIYKDWEKEGYTITQFLDKQKFLDFYEFIFNLFIKNLKNIRSFETSKFTLDKYHEFVDDKEHLMFLKYVAAGKYGSSGIPVSLIPFSYKEFDNLVSEHCGKKFTCIRRLYRFLAISKHFWLRVVRPMSKDNNPPHRDSHLKRNVKIINIYAPLAGSNEDSSLPIIPGSHFWSDSDLRITEGKTFVEGVKFTNPAIVSSKRDLKMITPNPKLGELMIFTPYAIHGGGRNFNSDLTRISLEMRFWPV